jgi:hypothetical protein
MINNIVSFLFLSLACGIISFTITKSVLFEEFRDFFFYRSNKQPGKFISNLVTCPYCFSHWVSLAIVLIWQPIFTNCGHLWVDLGVSVFAMVAVASYTWGIFSKITS